MSASTLSMFRVKAGQIPLSRCGDNPRRENQREPKLFVGSLSAAVSKEFFEENQISHVLSIIWNISVNLPEDHHAHHLIVKCKDHPTANILEVLPDCINFIKTAIGEHGSVLVHCASGVSRSVTVCVAFMMIESNFTVGDALRSVRSARKFANPNLGFKKQLELLEKCNGDITEAEKMYSMLNYDIMEDTAQQREKANDIHARVDEVEIRIASESHESKAQATSQELLSLQDQLHSSLSLQSIDTVAKIILKSALTKAERLLESIQCDGI